MGFFLWGHFFFALSDDRCSLFGGYLLELPVLTHSDAVKGPSRAASPLWETVPRWRAVFLEKLLACLLKYALLEIGPFAEELLVRRGGCMLRVFDRREFHGADVVRRLRKPVLGGLRRSVDDGVLRERVLDRAMERLGDRMLAVVVIDLDHIVGLQLREVVEEEVHEVPSHRPRELVERGELLGRVCKGVVPHGHVAEEDSERAEQHLARPQVEPRVLVLAVHERRRMEGYVREPLGAKGALICRDRIRDALGLVVHDDGKQVVAVGETVASRLVDEDAEFSHCSPG